MSTSVGAVAIENRIGLSEAHLSLLREDFGKLGAVSADLPAMALSYLVEGTHPEVLERLATNRDCGTAMYLLPCVKSYLADGRSPNRAARSKFFSDPPKVDVAFYKRLAEIYFAAWKPSLQPDRIIKVGVPDWLAIFLGEATGTCVNVYISGKHDYALSAHLVEQLAIAWNEPPDLLARAALIVDPKRSKYLAQEHVITGLAGFAGMISRHPEVVLEALNHPDIAQRTHVLKLMAQENIDPFPFAEKLVEMATGSSKTIRELAEPLLTTIPLIADGFLRDRSASGSGEQRIFALKLLQRCLGENTREFLQTRSEEDSSPKVKNAIAELLSETKGSNTKEVVESAFPPIEPVEPIAPLSLDARNAFAEALNKATNENNRNHRIPESTLTDAIIQERADFLEGNGGIDSLTASALPIYVLMTSADSFVQHRDVQPIHVVRLARLVGGKGGFYTHGFGRLASAYNRTHKPHPSLRQWAAVFKAVGEDPKLASAPMLDEYGQHSTLGLSPDEIWPYFTEHPELLEKAWHSSDGYSFQIERRHAAFFKILKMFPILPPQFRHLCWEIALRGTKKDRAVVQGILEKDPDKVERIVAALTGGKAPERVIAADWLGHIGDKQAIPALKKALAKEKQEQAAGAIMLALESLGVPLEEIVSMEGLLKEAKTLVDKGIPEDLSWFDFEKLPKVRWAQTGKPVRTEILQWMILLSHKLASPEPTPRIRQYVSYFDRTDADAFGQHVLESWIAQDTIPHSAAVAEATATKHVAALTQLLKTAPNMAGYYPGTPQDWYRQAYNAKLNEPIGTAQQHKGMLAVAGACCGGAAAVPVGKYLKTWYGMRVHQCRALIRMLSWIDHPSAIQLLLSIANRFRTASIRKEAETCVNELAERRNWTLEQLADRTIPSGGFDEELQLHLDYGPRQITVGMDSTGKLVIQDETGKTIKSLPEPRQSDDAEKAAAAKKQLSAAKKEIDSVLKPQKERLYESMCTQRTWTFGEWEQFLHRHPIMRLYTRRLVWGVIESGKVTKTFRPMEDGTLTDVNDESITLEPEAKICLAHDCNSPAEIVKKWQAHLQDYEVPPLFEQLGKPIYALADAMRDAVSMDEFRGHVLQAFALRNRLTKCGYTRGAVIDGPYFNDYHKRFPTLGIQATVTFSGNSMPEQDRPVAIDSLQFSRTAEGEGPADGSIPLGEVPAVLLSECWNDVRSAAAQGTGFDPEWEQKFDL